MSTKNQQSTEGALAIALQSIRHTDECHKSYVNFKDAQTKLDASKKAGTCSRCATGSKTAKHSPECRAAWTTFDVARKLLRAIQDTCGKCQTRNKLQGVVGHGPR